jgi:hypothetical protein
MRKRPSYLSGNWDRTTSLNGHRDTCCNALWYHLNPTPVALPVTLPVTLP